MATTDTPDSKTPSTDTPNPSTTTVENTQTSTIEAANNPTSSPPQSPVKRKRDEQQDEEGEDGLNDVDNPKKAKPSSEHPLHKTSLCSYFRRNSSGCCSHGEGCRFAHSEEELRPRPDGSWDPTSQRAKKREVGDEGEEESGDGDEEKGVMMTEVLGEDGDPELSKCLVHLPRKWTSDQLKAFLSEQGVVFKSAKKKKGMSVGFLTFEAAEQVKSATELLEGKSVGNEKKLKFGDVIPRSCDEKIKSAQKMYQNVIPGVTDDAEATIGSAVIENGEEVKSSAAKGKSARDAVTPLAHLPYTEQLEQKKYSLMQLLKKLTRNARKACPKGVPLPEWVVKSREIGGLSCKLEGIIQSPLVNGYRNKCEFSVGYSVQGKPTVGFMLGNFREGVTAVEEPTNCPNVSRVACNYALIFQDFLQDSALPVWNRFNNAGFWRQLTVREGRSPQNNADAQNDEANISEVMLIVQVSTEGCDDNLVKSELEKLTQAFVGGAASTSPPLPLTALALQDHRGISNAAPADAPLRPLHITTGQSSSETEVLTASNECRIHDYIGNLRFSISPTAFFQVNTQAAEKLYTLAGDWAGLGQDTLLFDVCCGTGTIGLTLANRVGMVVGIEMNASAVADAQRNAELNAITNCKFICSKAEDVMSSLLKEYLDDTQDHDDDAIPNDQKQNGTTENQTTSENQADPEDCSNEVNMDACGSNITEEVLQSHAITNESASKCHFKNVVAIVDPPRSGLHPVVLKALRTHPRLKRLVYISCNPETLMANAIELCTPLSETTEKGRRGQGWRNMSNAGLARHRLKSMPMSEPFQPVKAMAVDLFPHTPHCELVMLLER